MSLPPGACPTWLLCGANPARTVAEAARAWLASRIDVEDSTGTRNGLEVDRIIRLLGAVTLDLLTPELIQDFINALVEEEYA